MNKSVLARVLFLGTLWWVSPAFALTEEGKVQDVAPEVMMQQAMRLGSPSDKHRLLEPMVGRWNVSVKGWTKPGDTPQISSGTAETSWILGGRFLKQEFKGSWAGVPFEGLGYTGYDNIRQEFIALWMDNFATGWMKTSGFYNQKFKTFTFTGEFSCPMTGEKAKWVRSELKIKNNDLHIYSSFFKQPDGQEFKAMEITYSRGK